MSRRCLEWRSSTVMCSIGVLYMNTVYEHFFSVVGAIALTLQPLWPDSSREMVWYVSMAVLVLMSFMILLIVGKVFQLYNSMSSSVCSLRISSQDIKMED